MHNNFYIVEEQPNPSTDYYILPALESANINAIKSNFEQTPSQESLINATIIFVRYIPESWAKLINANITSIKKIILFMDDDVLDFNASSKMPWQYRYKLLKLSTFKKSWLKKHKVELWVSTTFLLDKYAEWHPKLVLPSSIKLEQNPCRIFYHGSLTHQAEVHWLRPIVEEVLEKNKHITFDIVGGKETFNLYKGLPRVTTIHPMKWPAYKQFTHDCKGQIGLAPLLDVPFNKARSYTKFFDFTRNDAVGIYSQSSEYDSVIDNGKHGILLPLEPDQWVNTIISLANDKENLHGMLDHAKSRVQTLNQIALKSYQSLSF